MALLLYVGAEGALRAVVGRVEWEVLHGVEKVRGSRGGRGACDSVFRGFPPYRHCQIIQNSPSRVIVERSKGDHKILT